VGTAETSTTAASADAHEARVVGVALRALLVRARQVLARGPGVDGAWRALLLGERVLVPFACIGTMRFMAERVRARRDDGRAGDHDVGRGLGELRSALDSLRSLAHDALASFAQGRGIVLEAEVVAAYAARALADARRHAAAILGDDVAREPRQDDSTLDALSFATSSAAS